MLGDILVLAKFFCLGFYLFINFLGKYLAQPFQICPGGKVCSHKNYGKLPPNNKIGANRPPPPKKMTFSSKAYMYSILT